MLKVIMEGLLSQIDVHRYRYSEVPIVRPPMVLVENGLNSEQVSLMRPICVEKMYFGT